MNMDKIIIKGLKIFAYHGVHAEEKENGQDFIIDVTLRLSLDMACRTDDIDRSVNYSLVTKVIIEAFTKKKYNLIEKAADVVADEILKRFMPVEEVTVCVKKPNAPVKADFDYMAVEITRNIKDRL